MIKQKLLTLFVALFATTVLWASNTITYTAWWELSGYEGSLNVGATTFGPAITSHTFSNGTRMGTITCSGEITTIGDYAFYYCSVLNSVTIPNSVTTIGKWAFCGCNALPFNHITIPNSVTKIGDGAFYNCSELSGTNYTGTIADWCKIKFGSSSSNPMYYSHDFYINDVEVKDLVIPEGVDTIGDYAFYNCSGLTSVTIPYSVTTIGQNSFYGCTNLQNVYYENYFSSYGSSAFPSTATLICKYPIKVSITNTRILDVMVEITIPKIYYEWYDEIGLSDGKTSTANHFVADANGKIVFADMPLNYSGTYYIYAKRGTEYVYKDAIQVSTALPTLSCSSFSMLTSITISNISASTDESVQTLTKGIKYNGKYYEADENNTVTLSNLQLGRSYTIYLYGCYNGEYYEQSKTVSTKTPSLSCSSSSTQTTITLSNIYASSDTSVHSLSKGIYYRYTRYEADENNKVVITGIAPNTKCTLQIYGCYNGQYYYGDSKYVTTQAIAPILSVTESPTCIYAKGSYTHGDATILGTSVACTTTGSSVIGDEGLMTGLKPNTDYSFTYSVNTKEGGTYTATKTITTPALTLTTLTPKVVSAGTAIVAASTNISDYETNVGFEWRKDNAPAGSASKSGAAIICNGIMEGRLLNLGTDWWKVRPYYEAADGTRYYGEWEYIDPTDASYFEPTVHTYAMATSPTNNKVQVRGYVMTGTDDVTEQGFEYWIKNAKVPNRMQMNTANADADVIRVQASGQVMTAVLENLAYSTTYTCRAYAIAGGKTYYGEEVQFFTPEDSRPIYTLSVTASENGSVNTDISGQYREGETVTLTATPEQGFRFIQWSDGNTDNPRQLTITANTELVAIFELADGLEDIYSLPFDGKDAHNSKFIFHNRLLIFRNGKFFNAFGGEVRK
ncbi:MAG: leucine-rich repeat protein [Paludibacteraceae bacterium]|nr:leucine-rich repeat protein [Paludibacteraceae bacterium]